MVRPAVRRGRSEGAGQSTRLIHSRKMRGATRSKAAHLQVVLATDLTAVLSGNEAGDARAGGEILHAENRAARAEVAAGQASIRLPHDRKGQELSSGLAQPLGYPCPETPCLPSSSRRSSRRHRGSSKSCRDLCRGEEMALYDVRGGQCHAKQSGVDGRRAGASCFEWTAARARRTDGDVVATLKETGVPARLGIFLGRGGGVVDHDDLRLRGHHHDLRLRCHHDLRLLRLHRVLRRVLLRLRRDRGRQGRVSAEARGLSGNVLRFTCFTGRKVERLRVYVNEFGAVPDTSLQY